MFAGEYLVASKRSGNFDWSLGLGWGYLEHADFSNPLYPHRPQEGSVSGGQTNIQSMFHGPIAIFGGVQWQSPLRPWLLKMELDGSNYKNEPAGRKDLGQKLPLNFGAVYRYGRNTDISIGLERGNKIMLGLTSTGIYPKPVPSNLLIHLRLSCPLLCHKRNPTGRPRHSC